MTFDKLISRPSATVFTDELTNIQSSESPNIGADSLNNSEWLAPTPSEMLPSERRSIVHENRDVIIKDLDVNDVAFINTIDAPSCPGATSCVTGVIKARAEMNSFGESPNHILEIGGSASSGATTF